MNIPVKVDEEFVCNVIEEYCATHACPVGCPFDKLGYCMEDKAFNVLLDRYKEAQRNG